MGEILAGELHTHPRPAPRHARAYSALGYLIGGPFDGGRDGPGGWWILDEPVRQPPFEAISFPLGHLWA